MAQLLQICSLHKLVEAQGQDSQKVCKSSDACCMHGGWTRQVTGMQDILQLTVLLAFCRVGCMQLMLIGVLIRSGKLIGSQPNFPGNIGPPSWHSLEC